ncbi:hypothetical protein BCR44DRAFT_1496422 [Catenaria anguillulae PL171]|uniref:Uncharacterized protein n=1 Tax=Catenaria anguillulae PL171 TaxID=765915 RepID=A0A1Y2HXY5_9FUNG|nr:hypothetical protein BCR44DRAFT_1496422 [Catenaria anguillulae PL171]
MHIRQANQLHGRANAVCIQGRPRMGITKNLSVDKGANNDAFATIAAVIFPPDASIILVDAAQHPHVLVPDRMASKVIVRLDREASRVRFPGFPRSGKEWDSRLLPLPLLPLEASQGGHGPGSIRAPRAVNGKWQIGTKFTTSLVSLPYA